LNRHETLGLIPSTAKKKKKRKEKKEKEKGGMNYLQSEKDVLYA
jgi:hypothetical protein